MRALRKGIYSNNLLVGPMALLVFFFGPFSKTRPRSAATIMDQQMLEQNFSITRGDFWLSLHTFFYYHAPANVGKKNFSINRGYFWLSLHTFLDNLVPALKNEATSSKITILVILGVLRNALFYNLSPVCYKNELPAQFNQLLVKLGR